MIARVLVMESRRSSVSPPRVLPATPVEVLAGNVDPATNGSAPVAKRLRSQRLAPAARDDGPATAGNMNRSTSEASLASAQTVTDGDSSGEEEHAWNPRCARVNFPMPLAPEEVLSRVRTKCDKRKHLPRHRACSDKFCDKHGEVVDDMAHHLTSCHTIEQQQVLAEAARVGVCDECGWAQEGLGVGHQQCAGRYGSKLHIGAPGATDMDIIVENLANTAWATERSVRKACAIFNKIATFEIIRAPHYWRHRHPVMSTAYLDRVRAIALKLLVVINSPRGDDSQFTSR